MNNRNVDIFSQAPATLDMSRSLFPLNFSHKTTFNVGELVPFGYIPCLPGDTWSIDTSQLARTTTMLFPVFDSLFLDFYFFFIPERLVWKDFKKFMGEVGTNPFYPQTDITRPTLNVLNPTVSGSFLNNTHTVFEHLYGIDLSERSYHFKVTAYQARAFALVYNEFFRDQNNQNAIDYYDDSVSRTASVSSAVLGGALPKVNKYHDYFTSCLPNTQRSESPVGIPIELNNVPVIGSSQLFNLGSNTYKLNFDQETSLPGTHALLMNDDGMQISNNMAETSYETAQYSNLVASGNANYSININELRYATQLQKYYERSARSGSRYTEYLAAAFHVKSPDSRLQRPEFIGGKRIPLMIYPVAQTSASSSGGALGSLSAYSLTQDSSHMVSYSCLEHGIIIPMACVRYKHTYGQGIRKDLTRVTRLDIYDPIFANIGEQPVFKSELYAISSNTFGGGSDERAIFGYQEAWADYRYQPDLVTGGFRPINGAFKEWSYADGYTQSPTLNESWLAEAKENVDRTLAVTSSTCDQIMLDINFTGSVARCMPMHSIPGLMDHH